jgi:hypothetical protein
VIIRNRKELFGNVLDNSGTVPGDTRNVLVKEMCQEVIN